MNEAQRKMARLLALTSKQHHSMPMKPLPSAIRRMFLNGLPAGWGQ